MIFAFLSRRVRAYVLFTLMLPLAGRLLEAVGVRVGRRNARAGELLGRAGGYARQPPRHLRTMYHARRRRA